MALCGIVWTCLCSLDKTNWHKTKGNAEYIYAFKEVGNRWKQSGQVRQLDQPGNTRGRGKSPETREERNFKIK